MYDYAYAIEQGYIAEDYYVWWGYEDEKLFEYAKTELLEMASQDKPFNFTMLTADTHFEDGYVCRLCDETSYYQWNNDSNTQYKTVFKCSDRQVTDFVSWIQEQDFYENTTIVISGDHPTMDSDILEDAVFEEGESVYTTYINAAADVTVNERREYTVFDLFPTTLAAMGAKIEGERLGLGTNLYSDKQTLTERYGLEVEQTELRKASKMMEDLAKIRKNKKLIAAEINGFNKASLYTLSFYPGALNGTIRIRVNHIVNMPERIDKVYCVFEQIEDEDGNFENITAEPFTLEAECLGHRQYLIYDKIDRRVLPEGTYRVTVYAAVSNGESYYIGEKIREFTWE